MNRRGSKRNGRRGKKAGQQASGQLNVSTIARFPAPPALHRFVRCGGNVVLSKAAGDQGFAITPALNTCVSSGEFTALFDQYRIVKIELLFFWQRGASDAVTRPLLWFYQDWDGSTTPASASEVFERQSFRSFSFSEARPTFTVTINRPGVNMSTVAANTVTVRSPWLDCSTAGQVHYGLYGWGAAYNSTVASGDINYIPRLTIELRSSR
jgi:hypothetical protein